MRPFDAAPAYISRGWPVFPVRARGKEPLIEGGFHRATLDLGQIAVWRAQWPDANIGFPPGQAGILVVDLDGIEARRQAALRGILAEPTLTVETARGWHLYFHHPGGHIGNRKLGPGIDVRADAGYVLLPPSVHPTGAVYRALGKMDEIRSLPPDVVNRLRRSAPKVRPHAPKVRPHAPEAPPINAGTPRRRRYVQAAVEAECMAIVDAPRPTPDQPGGRNDALNKAAFSLARFVETGEVDPGKLADLLTFAGLHAGLEEEEISKTIGSAFGARGVAA